MAKKTFKIGEYAIGGIITAETLGSGDVRLRALDWTSKKEVTPEVCTTHEDEMLSTLLDWTSYYHADNVMDWIKANQ